MDPYLWTLLLSGLAQTALAVDARPHPTSAAQREEARLEQLINAHREMARGTRLFAVGAPAGASVRPESTLQPDRAPQPDSTRRQR